MIPDINISKFLNLAIAHACTNSLVIVHAWTDGVWVSILGANVTNDGYVALDDLTDEGGDLRCNTNKMDCCKNTSFGDWYFPDNNTVTLTNNTGGSFLGDRGPRFVRMYCAQCSMHHSPPRGRYRCTAPNATNVNQTFYVNICRLITYDSYT